MSKKRLGLLAMAMFFGCTLLLAGMGEVKPAQADKPLTIGFVIPLTGDIPKVGESSRFAAEMLREEIEYMGPVRIRDVEESQQKIVNVIRRLEESGEIIVSRGKGDEVIA